MTNFSLISGAEISAFFFTNPIKLNWQYYYIDSKFGLKILVLFKKPKQGEGQSDLH